VPTSGEISLRETEKARRGPRLLPVLARDPEPRREVALNVTAVEVSALKI
jgi:hypothetical protein